MKDLLKNKAFWFGFICGILTFNIIDIWIENRMRGTGICFDCVEEIGLPFRYLQYGGNPSFTKILWFGLIADIFFAIIFSFTAGLICKFVWSEFTSKKLK